MAHIGEVFNLKQLNGIPLYTNFFIIPPQLASTRGSLETLIGYFRTGQLDIGYTEDTIGIT
jgi:hypothetical protein